MNVRIFTKNFCPHCTEVRKTLDERGLEFQETDLTSDEELFAKLKSGTQQNTVPFVFIDNVFIGGSEDLKRHVILQEVLGQ